MPRRRETLGPRRFDPFSGISISIGIYPSVTSNGRLSGRLPSTVWKNRRGEKNPGLGALGEFLFFSPLTEESRNCRGNSYRASGSFHRDCLFENFATILTPCPSLSPSPAHSLSNIFSIFFSNVIFECLLILLPSISCEDNIS